MWVNPAVGRITSGYGMRWSPTFGDYRLHEGTDIDGVTGDPVWAASSGTVVYSQLDPHGGGQMIKIAHGGGIETWYLHLHVRHVVVGTSVAAGQQIGTVGNTGNSEGDHLHFETRVNGAPQNPAPFMTARGVTLGSGTPPTTPAPDPEPVPDVQEDDMLLIRDNSTGAVMLVIGGIGSSVLGGDYGAYQAAGIAVAGVSADGYAIASERYLQR
ncbi:MAG: peptidase [Oerskovia sp.]|jgi:hypothetical protein|nr:peptidase [Oerskovia sp.]